MNQPQMGFELSDLWNDPNKVRQELNVPNVDLVAAAQSGGLPGVTQALSTAATKTPLFQSLLDNAKSAAKTAAESRIGKLIVGNPMISGLVAIVGVYAIYKMISGRKVAANPRKAKKQRRKNRKRRK